MSERLTTIIYTIENTTDTAIKILKDEITSLEHKFEEFVNQNGEGRDDNKIDKNASDAFDDFVDD